MLTLEFVEVKTAWAFAKLGTDTVPQSAFTLRTRSRDKLEGQPSLATTAAQEGVNRFKLFERRVVASYGCVCSLDIKYETAANLVARGILPAKGNE